MKLSKKAITILLSIFAVLCVFLFINQLILTLRYAKFLIAWGFMFDLYYLLVHSLTAICLLGAFCLSIYYIAYIAEVESFKKVIEALLMKRDAFKKKQAEKKAERKEEARKSKIERLQNQLNELSNDNED